MTGYKKNSEKRGAGHFNVQKPDGLFNLPFSYSQNNVQMCISFQNLIHRQNRKYVCYKMEYVFINLNFVKAKTTEDGT